MADDSFTRFGPVPAAIARHVVPMELVVEEFAGRPGGQSLQRVGNGRELLVPLTSVGRFREAVADAEVTSDSDDEYPRAFLRNAKVHCVQQSVRDFVAGHAESGYLISKEMAEIAPAHAGHVFNDERSRSYQPKCTIEFAIKIVDSSVGDSGAALAKALARITAHE